MCKEPVWRRRIVTVFGTWLLLALLILASGPTAFAAEPIYGGTLTVGMESEPRGFDPIKAGWLTSRARSHIMAVEERLFDADEKGNMIPELGLSATPSKDGKVWTIKLRQGVSFHDGTPFNADAVVAHWQRILSPENKFRGAATIRVIQSVEKVDDFTIRFLLKHAWAEFIPLLTSQAAIAAYIPSPKAVADGTQHRAPVGTGPFMFKEWLSGDRLVVVKNPNYWRKGRPYLDKIVYRTMPDMLTRYASLQSGEVDIIYTDWGKSITSAKEDPNLQVFASDENGAGIFLFNTSKPPLDDVRVRRALAHAWDQARYIKTLHQDVHPIAHDPYGETLACGDVGYRQPDLEQARKLIKEYGKPVEIEYLHTNTQRGREAGAVIQQMFKDIGVAVNATPLTLGQIIRRVLKNDYQMSGWSLVDSPIIGAVLNLNLHSTSRSNRSHYKNTELDQLLDTQRMSTDPEVRNEALCGIARIINEDVPLLYRLGWRYHLLGKKSVQGITSVRQAVVQVKDTWLQRNLQASN